MTVTLTLDIGAIVLSAFICFSLAAFWFSPALFGTFWRKAIETEQSTPHRPASLRAFALTFVMLLLFSAVVNIVVDFFGAVGMMQGIVTGIVIWLAITFSHAAVHIAFDRRSFMLFALYAGYYLVAAVISSTLFALWR
ncbi:MAG: DUF1761 domain-containing protein [Bacteroidota bacterium]